ncbi:ABC transporter permease subunit [Rhodobacterales bacterium HKCCE2091]|nr:ABC transporter permease subunit [Rhodobacterales bacterium HKCCE2091]
MSRLPGPFLALLLVALLLPLVPLATWSVAHGWRFPDLLPRDWSLDAWAYALSPTAGVLRGLGLTAAIAGAATAGSLVIGLPAGRALGLYRFRGRAAVEILVLAPVLTPGIAAVFGLHALFLPLGLTNTVAGVALAHLIPVLPYTILVLSGVFAGYDTRAEYQARSLGASPFQVLRHVTWPAIRPGVIVAALFAFLVSWSQYLLTLVIGGGRVQTLPLQLFAFAGAGRADVTGAIAVVYVLPGILVLVLTSRRLTGRSAALAGFGR